MSSENDQLSVEDNAAKHRYEVHAEGEIAVLEYKREDGRILLIHTEVPPALMERKLCRFAPTWRPTSVATTNICRWSPSHTGMNSHRASDRFPASGGRNN